jgi:hypothetical protein
MFHSSGKAVVYRSYPSFPQITVIFYPDIKLQVDVEGKLCVFFYCFCRSLTSLLDCEYSLLKESFKYKFH